MCNAASIALIGGGTLLNTVGQHRSLRAQQRVLDSMIAADEEFRQQQIETVLDATESLLGDLSANRTLGVGQTVEALSGLGVADAGGAADIIASAQNDQMQRRDQKDRMVSRDALMDVSRRLGRSRHMHGLQNGVNQARLQAAGARGGTMRGLGNLAIGAGQLAAMSATPERPAGGGAATPAGERVLSIEQGSGQMSDMLQPPTSAAPAVDYDPTRRLAVGGWF